jgi:hypothetical protein
MAIINIKDEGSPNYRLQAAPTWGFCASNSTVMLFRKFLGRAGEDLRILDPDTKTFKKVEGPEVEIPLFEMSTAEFATMQSSASTLNGVVFIYKVKDKENHKGMVKKTKDKKGGNPHIVIAGALWVPG